MNEEYKLEWFGGNQDALNMYLLIVDLAHIWDDIIDKDRPVSEQDVNRAFLIALVYLPSNPFYRTIQHAVAPMMLTMISAYQTANHFENAKDLHGVEIAHGLRYAVGHIISYASIVCLGYEKASQVMPELWKSMMCERFDAYKSEVVERGTLENEK